MSWLRRFLLFSLLVMTSVSSFAALPSTDSYGNWRFTSGDLFYQLGAGPLSSTPEESCEWARVQKGYASYVVQNGPPFYAWTRSCVLKNSNGVNGWGGGLTATLVKTCPSNSTLQGSQCECNSGYVEEAASCVPYQQKCGTIGTPPGFSTGGSASFFQGSASDKVGDVITGEDGCKYKITSVLKSTLNGVVTGVMVDTVVAGQGETGLKTGSPVSASDTSSIEAYKQAQLGKCPGQVNGVTVYVDCTSTTVSTQAGTVTTAKTAGGVATTNSTVGTDGNTTTTSCVGSQCITSVVTPSGAVVSSSSAPAASFCTTNPTHPVCAVGGVGGTGTPTGVGSNESTDMGKFCASNPTSPLCVTSKFCDEKPDSMVCKSRTFSGACGEVPACDGDPIGCAAAVSSWQMYCAMKPTDQAVQAGQAAANGQDKPDGHPGAAGEVSAFSMASLIDQTDALGATSCPVDQSFQVGGVSITIPFSTVCPSLQLAGQLAVAAAMLAAMFIVFRT